MQPPASTGSRQLEDHLVSPAFVRDPYPALAHLRETDPVYWSDSIGGWLLTRYDDVVTGFKDVPAFSNEGRLGKAAEHLPAGQRTELAGFEAHYRTKGLLHSDPPDHTRLRRLVLRAGDHRDAPADPGHRGRPARPGRRAGDDGGHQRPGLRRSGRGARATARCPGLPRTDLRPLGRPAARLPGSQQTSARRAAGRAAGPGGGTDLPDRPDRTAPPRSR